MRHIITTTTDVISTAPRLSGGSTILMHVMAAPGAAGLGIAGSVPHLGAVVALGGVGSAIAGTVVAIRRAGGARRRGWLSLWIRLKLHIHPGPGFATRWDLWRRYGKPAARKVARHGRPSLTWSQLQFGRWQEYATYHGRAQGWIHRWRVYSTFEDITLVISAPQEGKSARAAGDILDAPGPVVATSIRGDLIAATAGLRARLGVLHIFNPEGVGAYGSTFAWNIVAGCEDPRTAIRRAGHMVEALTNRGLSDADFWTDQASLILSAYLHAAGLIGANIRTVYAWIMEKSEEPVGILTGHPQAAENAALQVNSYLEMPERTRSGVITTLNRVMKFMTDPAIVDMLCPPVGEGFDFDSFLTSKDTLYLVAADTANSPVSPLFVAFLAELTHHARLHPSRTGAKRLDPPLTLILDEVANIAPVPVANWATWAAGSGIRMNLYVQAWARVEERWGKEGAATLWQSAKTKVIFTAGSEDALCELVSTMCGKVRVITGYDVHEVNGKKHRKPRYETIDVLPAADVRQLPDGRAIVIRRNARPTIVRAEKYWDRADVKAYKRSGQNVYIAPPVQRSIPQVRPDLAGPLADVVEIDELARQRDAHKSPQDAPPLPSRRDQAPAEPRADMTQPDGQLPGDGDWNPFRDFEAGGGSAGE
jgi:type IV secretory pathway TraG/TraD family ATPase VirD4